MKSQCCYAGDVKTPIPSVTGGDVTGKVITTKQQMVDIDALTKKYGKQKEEVQEIEKVSCGLLMRYIA